MTTVRVPFFEMGRIAAERLLDLACGSGGAEPFKELLDVELVVRRSSVLK